MKEDALNKYQENCYLLGKIFSLGDEEEDSASSDSDMEEQEDDETKELQMQLLALQQDF